jgi:hypothetical protein
MQDWLTKLNLNPLPPLVECDNRAIVYFAEKDCKDKTNISREVIQALVEPQHLLKKQLDNGSWKYPGRLSEIRMQENYNQIETFRNIGFLIEKYDFDRTHPAMEKAAEYLFTFQTEEGDFRVAYGNQYATTYSAMITELLIKGGYGSDPRIEKSLEWFLSIRQNDGGWTVPLRTVKANYFEVMYADTIQPDRTKPFSHLVTGMVLRAFAESEKYNNREEIRNAAVLLISRFFKRDKYPDRSSVDYWYKFSFPFWFTDLLTSLDSISKIGFSPGEENIKKALEWFVEKQEDDGTWRLKLLRGRDKYLYLWISLVVCRIFSRFY